MSLPPGKAGEALALRLAVEVGHPLACQLAGPVGHQHHGPAPPLESTAERATAGDGMVATWAASAAQERVFVVACQSV
jgi:hypothetical protein